MRRRGGGGRKPKVEPGSPMHATLTAQQEAHRNEQRLERERMAAGPMVEHDEGDDTDRETVTEIGQPETSASPGNTQAPANGNVGVQMPVSQAAPRIDPPAPQMQTPGN